MKNAVGYCRVSSAMQAGEDKFGLPEQKHIIKEYAKKNGYIISDWYIDAGISGTREDRPALNRLLYGEVSNPPVECVICAKSDRIARDIKLYYYILMLLEKKCINLVSATERDDELGDGMGGIYKALMMFVAEQERRNITIRTTGGKIQKAAKGGYAAGRPPYGYHAENKKLVVSPDEAAVVREVFRMRRSGMPAQAIGETLYERGIKTRSNRMFTPRHIFNIIENELTYHGYYRYGKSGWVPGMQDPILDIDEFPLSDKAQQGLKHLVTQSSDAAPESTAETEIDESDYE